MTRASAFLALAALGFQPAAGVADEQASTAEPAEPAEPAEVGDAAFREIDAFIAEQGIDKTRPRWKSRLPEPPKLGFDPKKRYLWELETNQGRIVVQLLPDVAPMHASSTIYLTRLGFYDGTLFHRVIPGFMAQGGDPLGNGTGGPGYQYAGELSSSLRHDQAGRLSMANRGPGTDGSQFFLTFAATPWLDGKHTIFGEVVGGKQTLSKLEKLGTPSGRPAEQVRIEKASVRVE